MKKILLLVIVGASLLYGNQVLHTTESLKTKQTELEQIKKEIEQLKYEQSEAYVLKYDIEKNNALKSDIEEFLNELYTNKGTYENNRHYKSYILTKYRIVSYDIQARIEHISIETEVEWESSSNDEKLNGTSIDSFQLMNLDGKFSVVSIKESNEV